MAKKLTEPRRTPEEIRAKVAKMLNAAIKVYASPAGGQFSLGAVWLLEDVSRWPECTAAQFRARLMESLAVARAETGSNAGGRVWELERLLRWIDGLPEDAWDE